jgi:hypothetical protein
VKAVARNPIPGGALAASAILAAASLLLAAPAPAAAHIDTHPARLHTSRPLHVGGHGQRVKDLQWLLQGKKPSAYRGIATLDPAAKPDGKFGRRTAYAVVAMKKRLGWPDRALQPIAGRDFFQILLGKQRRPVGWIARAAKRLKTVTVTPSPCADRVIATAKAELGVREIPDGSNDGARIRTYQSVTGAYHAPWCASYVQWVLRTARYGTIADHSATVFYITRYAYTHGWSHAIARPGALVGFLRDQGHIGIVERVTAHGFYSIEGNHSNRVAEVYRRIGEVPMVFIWLPGCS